MREYGKFFPTFWIGKTGKEIKNLGRDAQVLAMYLMTSPHSTMIGIYYLPLSFICHETGIPFKGALKTLQSIEEIDFCTYDTTHEYIWVHNMAHYQVGDQLKQQDNRVKCINDIFNKLPDLPFLPLFFEKYKHKFWLENTRSFEASSPPLQSKDKEQEKEQEQKKTPMSGTFKSQAHEVLQFLNEKTGRVYRPVDTNLKLIIARLKSGATVMDCRQVIAKKTREWRSDAKMSEYLRPATLFNATKFEQYMGELVTINEESTYVTK